MLFGDNIRGLMSATDNALAGDEKVIPATKTADLMLHKNLGNFAQNSGTSVGLDDVARLARIDQAIQAALALSDDAAGRHLASKMPPSPLNPAYVRKTGLGNFSNQREMIASVGLHPPVQADPSGSASLEEIMGSMKEHAPALFEGFKQLNLDIMTYQLAVHGSDRNAKEHRSKYDRVEQLLAKLKKDIPALRQKLEKYLDDYAAFIEAVGNRPEVAEAEPALHRLFDKRLALLREELDTLAIDQDLDPEQSWESHAPIVNSLNGVYPLRHELADTDDPRHDLKSLNGAIRAIEKRIAASP
jgi:hypothetical protein